MISMTRWLSPLQHSNQLPQLQPQQLLQLQVLLQPRLLLLRAPLLARLVPHRTLGITASGESTLLEELVLSLFLLMLGGLFRVRVGELAPLLYHRTGRMDLGL